jgi:hypothetical protein
VRIAPAVGLREVAARVVARVLLHPVEVRLAERVRLARLGLYLIVTSRYSSTTLYTRLPAVFITQLLFF